jgi:hypothetical protein
MGVHNELRKLGYCFEYEHGDSEDRTEVWVNEPAEMAIRIEWMKVEATIRKEPKAVRLARGAQSRSQRDPRAGEPGTRGNRAVVAKAEGGDT